MTYIAAIHVPVAGLALLPLLVGLPPMLYPMHLVLLELIIDPLGSIVFEAESSEADAMARPPRNSTEPLFGASQMAAAAILGLVLLAAVFLLYLRLSQAGIEVGEARVTAFIALVAGHLALAAAVLAGSSRRALETPWVFWLVAAAASLLLVLMVAVPELRSIMRFSSPTDGELLTGLGVGLIAGGWPALPARLFRRRTAASGAIVA
jgi:Ca2+-transporting ATPase